MVFAACGGPVEKLGPDGQPEEGTAGSALSAAQSLEPSTTDDTTYTAQATICPGSTKVYGIDVSYYQGTISWSQVKAAGKQFAIVRVSDGTGFLDPKFEANWKGAKAAGIVVVPTSSFAPTKMRRRRRI